MPDWLARINAGNIGQQFPLMDILQNSLFYPAAADDGDPVAYLAGNFFSFIYVDYAFSRHRLTERLKQAPFSGYEVEAQRSVDFATVDRGVPDFPLPQRGSPSATWLSAMEKPFCEWIIFRRKNDFQSTHGPLCFSLLYLCAEGVATFQTLYVRHRICPAAVAIIQSGGLNWTDFRDPSSPFGETVLGNPAGKPDVLLYGGQGDRQDYRQPCWPEFSEGLGFLGDTGISVWLRPRNGADTAATTRS